MNNSKQDNLKVIFSKNLIRLRLHKKISQIKIAKILGRDPRTIRRWENEADTTWPPASALPNLATCLDCTINDFFNLDSQQLPHNALEREILTIAREAKQNLPMGFIIHQLKTLVLLMDKDERILWQQIGDKLIQHKKPPKTNQ